MVTDPREWGIGLVERASTLQERLHGPFVPDLDTVDHAASDARLARWRELVADNDDARFGRRVEWEAVDEPTIRALLGAVKLTNRTLLPDWITLLADVADESRPSNENRSLALDPFASALRDRAVSAEAPLPFEDVLLPFVRVARRRLERRSGALAGWLTADAHSAFERALLQRLTSLAGLTLLTELSARQSVARGRGASLGILGGAPSRRLYDEYVDGLCSDGLLGLWGRYPMLARLLATRTMFWVDATCELVARLAADHAIIEATFSPGRALGKVVRAEAQLSDSHASGRSVAVLHFDGNLRVVYKPRSLGLEQAFSALLAWLNDGRAPLDLRALAVLDRETHGWVQYADFAPCEDEAAAQRYYQRGGMLLCLAYALGGGDMHSGNLIACGEHPVIIDLEVIMASLIRSGAGETVKRRGEEHRHSYWNSVLRTGLLPARAFRSNGASYVEGGLAGSLTSHMTRRQLWRHVNTDLMSRGEEDTEARQVQRGAHVGDRPCVPTAYADQLIAGFRQMYEVLRAHKAALLGSDGPLTPFRRHSCRVILRDTRVYDALLKRVAHPRFLRNGVDLSIELDVLKCLDLRSEARSWLWPAWEAEQRELHRLDIPLFRVSPDTATLTGNSDVEVPDAFEDNGFDSALARLAAFDDADLNRQLHFIRVALVAVRLAAHRSVHRSAPPASADVQPAAVLTTEMALEEARSIANGLEELALDDGEGGTTWVGMVEKARSARSELRDIGFDLYSGRTGVALFFAALAKVSGEGRYRTSALRALGSFAEGAHQRARRLAVVEELDIGGGSGIGGIIYALVRVSQLTEASVLLRSAQSLAEEITPARIETDVSFDLLGGGAGAILGLLSLYDATGDVTLLERAARCGRHVLDGRVTEPTSGQRAWANGDRMLSGFGHGAAGIGYAMDRLYDVTRCAIFADAALETRGFVDRCFVEARGNWLEHGGSSQTQDVERLWCSWCHGAAGIGLGRVGALNLVHAPDARASIDAALATVATRDYPAADHLCCGSLGRAELLCEAAQRYGRPELIAAARAKAGDVVSRARRRDAYATGFDCEYAPAFFQGLAGIGYELLRLARPDQLQSVLLWQ